MSARSAAPCVHGGSVLASGVNLKTAKGRPPRAGPGDGGLSLPDPHRGPSVPIRAALRDRSEGCPGVTYLLVIEARYRLVLEF